MIKLNFDLLGWTTLHQAAYKGDYKNLLMELNSGIDPNIKSDKFESYGTFLNKEDWMKWTDYLHFKKKKKIYFKNVTPLYLAAANGHSKCVKLLMLRGGDPKIKAMNMYNKHVTNCYIIALLCGKYNSYYIMKNTKEKPGLLLNF